MRSLPLLSLFAVITPAIAHPDNQYSLECVSIVALASTRDPDYGLFDNISGSDGDDGKPSPSFESDEMHDEREQFECVLPSGFTVPISGTDNQLDMLRDYLNKGTLVSGESTLDGLTMQFDDEQFNAHGFDEDANWAANPDAFAQAIKSAVMTLPSGEWDFKPSQYSQHTESTSQRRKLATYEGAKKTLVVRIIDKNGLANPDSPSVMSDKIFGTYGDRYTMTSQFEACSYGKMKITNDYGFSVPESAPGVIEVTVDVDIKKESIFSLRNDFKSATEAKLGRSLPGEFEHVLFVVEGCYESCGWAGFATVNGWLSVYHKHHYKSMAVTLHEIGHNLNLAHSGGDDGKEYTDHSCLMGNPWFKDDRGQMCFNPAKTFQIASAGAWYDNKYILTWDSGTLSPNFWKGNLIGVADYENNLLEASLVVKLHTSDENDFFIGFNRAYGINVDSKDANDMVTIIEAGNNGKGYSKSVMIAQLGNGQSYAFNNWRGSGKTMVVKVGNIARSSSPWHAEVELNFDNAPVPTDSPSTKPTASPSNKPTQNSAVFPSKTPSLSPTSNPTGSPSSRSPMTLSPTKQCGDMVCAIDETDVNCPDDCTQMELATFEGNIGAKGANGTMFSVQALRDVAITSISTFFRSDDTGVVQVFTKSGGYRGFEQNATAWTLIYNNTISQNGKDDLTHLGLFTNNTKVVVAKDEVQSFYVYSPNNLAYRQDDGVLEGDFVVGDNSLNFYAGVAIAYGQFGEGQLFSPRQFSGILRYDGISLATQQPTASPAPPTLCYQIISEDLCTQNTSCRWIAYGDGWCRRIRVGKASKRRSPSI